MDNLDKFLDEIPESFQKSRWQSLLRDNISVVKLMIDFKQSSLNKTINIQKRKSLLKDIETLNSYNNHVDTFSPTDINNIKFNNT